MFRQTARGFLTRKFGFWSRLPGDKHFRKHSFFLPDPSLTPALPTWCALHHGTCQKDGNTGWAWSFTFPLNQPFGSGRERKRKINVKIPAPWSVISGVTERSTLTFSDCCPQPRLYLESRAWAYSSTSAHLPLQQPDRPSCALPSPKPSFPKKLSIINFCSTWAKINVGIHTIKW